MIFVTVGTHEQPFDRLIQKVDELKRDGLIEDDVFMQIGYCQYQPKYCQFKQFISYDLMSQYTADARIVITHGGPASFMNVLANGKVPIVVPRQLKFNEHVNDHQLLFVKEVIEKGYDIKLIENIDDLEAVIKSFDLEESHEITSHTSQFVQTLENEVDKLMGDKK
ncbi:glycosyltransferase [Latilactobacillus sakei]|uniref:glycosyltransferase n=1 Tax=Latilactobacillus sakei TaxID=1599 RepID=UPI000FFBD1E6|nr:glycosyltransferase [Latilactobacillus sakei]RXA81536.1 multidrug MFS transporter [Latilactobacillus sakei]